MKPSVTAVFPTAVHFTVEHPSSLLESRTVTAILKVAAGEWAKENGKQVTSARVSGWTLGTDVSSTRLIARVTDQ